MEYTCGQVVYSKNGRDKGKPFIIKEVEGDYVYLTDGKKRLNERPKRKKIKHVQKTNYIDLNLKTKFENNDKVLDAHISKALKLYEIKRNEN